MKYRVCVIVSMLVVLGGNVSTARAQDVGSFVTTGEMIMARWGHAATLLNDGRVLITGGAQYQTVLTAAEIYDPATGLFTAAGDLNVARYGHSATLLRDGSVLIAGGLGGEPSRRALGSAELYDPSSGTFSLVGSMVTPQFMQAAALLPDNTVLVAGGQAASPPIAAAGAEIYDPMTGSFAAAGPYAARNSLWRSTQGPLWPTATLLPGGTVFIAGNNPAELYDPLTGTFRVTGAMTAAGYQSGMYWHTTTLLPNGTVLIAGGTDDWVDLANAELYDPSTETFAVTGSMTVRRSLHTATLLPNGTVLITGGETWIGGDIYGYFGGSLSSAEYYDPVTGNFVPITGMSAARSSHTATLLNDGTVLITGGVGYAAFQFGAKTPPPGLVATAEIYRGEF